MTGVFDDEKTGYPIISENRIQIDLSEIFQGVLSLEKTGLLL